MNTARIISCLLVMGAIIASCSEHERVVEDPKVYQELSIRAELPGHPVDIDDGSIIDLTGTTNCNLADNTCVSLYGVISNSRNGNFEIEHGSFRIMVEDTGCYLSGNFEGWGKNFFNSGIAMGGTAKVFCGTGAFQADGGELEVRLTGLDPNGNFILEIDGNLIR